MSDWRFVTEVKHTPSAPGSPLPPISNDMWIDLDGVDQIMPLPEGRYVLANTRLGWMTSDGWRYMFIHQQIDPTQPREANHNPQQERE